MNYSDQYGEDIRRHDHRAWEKVNGRWKSKALEAALEEPAIKESLTVAEQEPVACIGTNGKLMWLKKPSAIYSKPRPLYTAPPRKEWIGLTDADFEKEKFVNYNFMAGASFAEAKLRGKNT
jgi:hypothetical protein